ncbi:MAG TPA: outer membrane protein assembly factor BamD [Allosphingosinicella sp.]|jgi:outer membrane protein assembly factor BamD|nr:outer membrane protein assembly factor BamD [Allosphingosinicella sp.]
MRHFSRPIAAAVALVCVMSLSACAGRGKHTRADTQYVARDVNTLYNLAKDQLERGNYAAAAVIFDEVERQHPYSVWARRAQLMSAFSYYAAKEYQKAIDSSRRFLAIHPGNKDAPYAYYLVALSYYEQITDVERDQATSKQALDSLNELIRRYPDTRYAADARLKVDLVRDHLAGHEMEIGRFYENHAEWLAATLRFRAVVDEYQTTSHVPEALMRLTECYLALGLPEEARKSAAVLGANYPGTKWYQRAYSLTTRHPPRAVTADAEPVRRGRAARAPARVPPAASEPPPAAAPAPAPAAPEPAPAAPQPAPTPAPSDAAAQPHA